MTEQEEGEYTVQGAHINPHFVIGRATDNHAGKIAICIAGPDGVIASTLVELAYAKILRDVLTRVIDAADLEACEGMTKQ